MKNTLFLACLIGCTLWSCEEVEPPPVPSSYLNFTTDGIEYTFDVSQFSAWSPAAGNFNLRSPSTYGLALGVTTEFPYWFDIRKTSTGEICGMLLSKEFQLLYVENLDSCDFKIATTDLNGNPLSIPYAYFYENGTITYTKNDCGIRSYFDVYGCFCTDTAYMCDIEGTFNLTFKNDLGESITLSDGKFLQTGVFQ